VYPVCAWPPQNKIWKDHEANSEKSSGERSRRGRHFHADGHGCRRTAFLKQTAEVGVTREGFSQTVEPYDSFYVCSLAHNLQFSILRCVVNIVDVPMSHLNH